MTTLLNLSEQKDGKSISFSQGFTEGRGACKCVYFTVMSPSAAMRLGLVVDPTTCQMAYVGEVVEYLEEIASMTSPSSNAPSLKFWMCIITFRLQSRGLVLLWNPIPGGGSWKCGKSCFINNKSLWEPEFRG